MEKKLLLLGYMGCGKSAVGRFLAEKQGIPFVDLDAFIEKKEGLGISELFALKGEIYFRRKEREYLDELLKQDAPMVISLGGGTPCFGDTMQMLTGSGNSVVFLKASVQTLVERLEKEKEHRPLLKNLQTVDLEEFIRKHLFERNQFYMQAPHKVAVDDRSVEAIAEEVAQYLV